MLKDQAELRAKIFPLEWIVDYSMFTFNKHTCIPNNLNFHSDNVSLGPSMLRFHCKWDHTKMQFKKNPTITCNLKKLWLTSLTSRESNSNVFGANIAQELHAYVNKCPTGKNFIPKLFQLLRIYYPSFQGHLREELEKQ